MTPTIPFAYPILLYSRASRPDHQKHSVIYITKPLVPPVLRLLAKILLLPFETSDHHPRDTNWWPKHPLFGLVHFHSKAVLFHNPPFLFSSNTVKKSWTILVLFTSITCISGFFQLSSIIQLSINITVQTNVFFRLF